MSPVTAHRKHSKSHNRLFTGMSPFAFEDSHQHKLLRNRRTKQAKLQRIAESLRQLQEQRALAAVQKQLLFTQKMGMREPYKERKTPKMFGRKSLEEDDVMEWDRALVCRPGQKSSSVPTLFGHGCNDLKPIKQTVLHAPTKLKYKQLKAAPVWEKQVQARPSKQSFGEVKFHSHGHRRPSQIQIKYSRFHNRDQAARTIQHWFRSLLTPRRHLRELFDIEQALHSEFPQKKSLWRHRLLNWASSLDGGAGGNRLGSKSNKHLLEVEEKLMRILLKADGVESGGFAIVKEARKSLIREVQAFLDDVEKVKKAVIARAQ
ncbi:hypothetical protein BC830DRAFT_1132099 [Chytriomyces sp. MP71]|nr:hypothetical protein BC830DRAFT_1132099 [Chytriomyces sp. MP71]